VAAFDDADCVLVTEVYPAREPAPADGFSAALLVEQLAERRAERAVIGSNADACVYFAANLDEAGNILLAALQPHDAVLVLSAGDADQITARLLEELPQRQKPQSKEHKR
jgi:UDP-N-acetylmuramate-alanine ligase